MLQVQLHRFGGPEELEPVTVPDPEPGPGQVLIRTLAAGVTFLDTQVRAGRPPWPGPLPALPLVLGNGVAGVVIAADGTAGQALMGRTVITATGGFGGYSAMVAVPADQPFVLPDGLGPAEGLALLADGRTAMGLVRAAEVGPGDRVLVLAAGGGVGTLLVQLARARGADLVAAAASSAEKLTVAARLGADDTVNYAQPGWAADLCRRSGAPTVVFDGVGGELAEGAMDVSQPAARFVCYGGASGRVTAGEAVQRRGLRLIRGNAIVASPADNRFLVEQALAAAVAGQVRVVRGQQFELARAAAAHAAITSRSTLGKTVLCC